MINKALLIINKGRIINKHLALTLHVKIKQEAVQQGTNTDVYN